MDLFTLPSVILQLSFQRRWKGTALPIPLYGGRLSQPGASMTAHSSHNVPLYPEESRRPLFSERNAIYDVFLNIWQTTVAVAASFSPPNDWVNVTSYSFSSPSGRILSSSIDFSCSLAQFLVFCLLDLH